MRQSIRGVIVGALLLLGLAGCGHVDDMERWWYTQATGRAMDRDYHTCPVADLHDGRCQPEAAKGATP
jgi:hypothetical protein